MKKEKKQLTPTQQKKRYKALHYGCFAGEFVSTATPFVAIGIANYNKYFVEYSGTKVSISFFMAMAVMGFAIFSVSKKKFENSFISLLIMWAALAFSFTMLGSLITDLSTIMWFGLIGLTGAYGLDIAQKKALKKANEIQEGIDAAKQDEVKEAYKKEQTQKEESKKKKVRW